MLGSWNVNVSVGSMPEKVATAMAGLELRGAEYTPIAYLGSQVVNGINHAVLAEQLLIVGKDVRNIVVLIFNEKDMECSLVAIERVIESGIGVGGIVVDPKTDLSDELLDKFNEAFEGYVGLNVNIFAYLASQVVKGTNYMFAAEVEAVVENPTKRVAIIIANPLTKEIAITDLLDTKYDSLLLGYSFTWLKKENTALGSPLGEWP